MKILQIDIVTIYCDIKNVYQLDIFAAQMKKMRAGRYSEENGKKHLV